jgi:hypothetical protein
MHVRNSLRENRENSGDAHRDGAMGRVGKARCSGRDLFGGDESIVDPAMDRRRGDAEHLGGLLHGDELSVLGS